jgi:phenylacetate-coenzyme A ligase PaaK-like adenylate-forming protein
VVAAAEAALDLSNVRLVFLGGEPASPELRADLRLRLSSCGAGTVAIQNGYGFTEMQGPAVHCGEDGPYHVPTPAQYFVEIVDPASGEPVPDGTEGAILISHLNRRGTVLLRYAVGDLSVLERGPCPSCGLVGPRFTSPPRRSGELVKVKGTLISPAVLVQALFDVPKLLDFQVRVTYRDSSDPLSGDDLVVELVGTDAEDEPSLAEHVRAATYRAVEITPTVRFAPPDFRERIDLSYKTRRFVDDRDTTVTGSRP